MFKILKKYDFLHLPLSKCDGLHTKPFQHEFLRRYLPLWVCAESKIAEVGPAYNLHRLLSFDVAERWAIDPYDGKVGGGIDSVPEAERINFARCYLGENSSDVIPTHHFDLVFSSSVLEHIGQRESGFNCEFTSNPPPAQETKRDNFCRELFRILKPGGITIHAVDHGVRNLSYYFNFKNAGFQFVEFVGDLNVDEELAKKIRNDEDTICEKLCWGTNKPFPPEVSRLHAVLVIACFKPISF